MLTNEWHFPKHGTGFEGGCNQPLAILVDPREHDFALLEDEEHLGRLLGPVEDAARFTGEHRHRRFDILHLNR